MLLAKTYFDNENAIDNLAFALSKIMTEDTVIVCIGTDRAVGDSLGPMVGTLLEKNDMFKHKVYGTIKEPVHALNIHKAIDIIKTKHPGQKVIAIDAALGKQNCIGELRLRTGSIKPGAGVGKDLPQVGDHAIYGIVDASNEGKTFSYTNIRLNLIMEMAEIISLALVKAANSQTDAFFYVQ